MTYPHSYDPPTQPLTPVHPAGWDLARVDAQPRPYAGPMATNWTPATGYPPAPRMQITKDRRETRHGLHLVLSILTCGMWAVTGWPIAWAWNRFGPRRKTVTHYR